MLPQPDFHRFVDTIWRREPDRVPIAELGIDPPIKEKFLGKPVLDVATDVEFWWRGYDYMYLRPAYNSRTRCPARPIPAGRATASAKTTRRAA